MEPIQFLKSHAVCLPRPNIDTDQIIPAAYLKVTDKLGLGEGLFSNWRYLADGGPNPDFVLNQPRAKGAQILVGGDNFGCGSSREHAPWALLDYGFRAVISPRFADIFRNNALKNGLLTVPVEAEVHQQLLDQVDADPAAEIAIDVEARTVTLPGGEKVSFEIDGFARYCLLQGIDQLGYLLEQIPAIEAYEASCTPRVDTRAGD